MIWLDTFWSLALNVPPVLLSWRPVAPHLHQGPSSLLVFLRMSSLCVTFLCTLTHTGCGGASVVTCFSYVSLSTTGDCGKITLPLWRAQCLIRDFRMSSVVLGLHILQLFILSEQEVHYSCCAPWEYEAESLCTRLTQCYLGVKES